MNVLARNGFAWRVVLATLLSFAPPLIVFRLLEASGPLVALLGYCTLIESLFLIRLWRRTRRVANVLLVSTIALGALVVFVALDITPASAFLAWFKLNQHGPAGGTIAFMFCVDFAFFSSLFAGLVLTPFAPSAIAGYAFINVMLASVIVRNTMVAAAAGGILFLFVLYRALRQTRGARLPSVISAIEVLILSSVVALSATSASIHNVFVDRLFSIRLEGLVARIFPAFPFLYSVPGYGYSFSHSDMGGRPALTSRPVLEVTAQPGETLYLRTQAFDTFTGSGWVLSKEAREAAANGSAPGARVGSAVHQRLERVSGSGSEIRIRVVIDFLAALPTTLLTTTVEPVEGSFPPLSYGSEATGYVLSVPIGGGFRMVEIQQTASERRGSVGKALPDANRYLQTGQISERVKTLAASLRRPTPSATIAALRSYLADNYTYSLNTKRYAPHSNAVSDFLFGGRTGYCVQFATTFTILARLDGLPARYVTGFLVNIPERSSSAVVTGLSAHSWSEVWLPGQGWITVEATPPMLPAAFRDPNYYRDFNPTGSEYTLRQLRAVMGARVPPPPQLKRSPRPHLILPAAVAVLAAIAAGFGVRSLVIALLPRRRKIRRILLRTVRKTRAMHVSDPAIRGWQMWATELGKLTSREPIFRRACGIILELSFTDRPPNRREARFLKGLFRSLGANGGRTRPPLHRIAH